MNVRGAVALVSGLLAMPGLVGAQQVNPEAAEQLMSCAEYLSEPVASRERITGTYLWLYLNENRTQLTPNQAGSAISIVDTLRDLLDQWCLDPVVPGGSSSPKDARVVVGALIVIGTLGESLKGVE